LPGTDRAQRQGTDEPLSLCGEHRLMRLSEVPKGAHDLPALIDVLAPRFAEA
jgi:hypothetical protein